MLKTRHYIDIHMAPHVHDLTNQIRSKAIVLYFQPFSSIRLEQMSVAFGWTVDEVEQHVVSLIQSGDIEGRVDSQNKACKQFTVALVPIILGCRFYKLRRLITVPISSRGLSGQVKTCMQLIGSYYFECDCKYFAISAKM